MINLTILGYIELSFYDPVLNYVCSNQTMAATQAALNNYLDDPIRITAAATRAALNQQGLQSFDDFVTLLEKDITEICSNLRKPGGTLPNPAHDPANPIPGVPETISNPGIIIGHIYEKHLKFVRYYILHLQRIRRPMVPGTATLARLINCYNTKKLKMMPKKMTCRRY
jgi:hypothetical protein